MLNGIAKFQRYKARIQHDVRAHIQFFQHKTYLFIMNGDLELATLATSQLAIRCCLPQQYGQQQQQQQQQQQDDGVPGFPDFPSCWNGEEGSERKNGNNTNLIVDLFVDENDELERDLILKEAKALKHAAQTVRHRQPLRREAVNKCGMRKGSTCKMTKPKAYKKAARNGRKQSTGRFEMESLRKRLKTLQVDVKCKLE